MSEFFDWLGILSVVLFFVAILYSILISFLDAVEENSKQRKHKRLWDEIEYMRKVKQ